MRTGRGGGRRRRRRRRRGSQLESARRSCCKNSGHLGGTPPPSRPGAPRALHLTLTAGRTRRRGSAGALRGAAGTGGSIRPPASQSRAGPPHRPPGRPVAAARLCVCARVCVSPSPSDCQAALGWLRAPCPRQCRRERRKSQRGAAKPGLESATGRKGRSNSWFQTDKLLRRKQALRREGKAAAAARRSRAHLPAALASPHRPVGKVRLRRGGGGQLGQGQTGPQRGRGGALRGHKAASKPIRRLSQGSVQTPPPSTTGGSFPAQRLPRQHAALLANQQAVRRHPQPPF